MRKRKNPDEIMKVTSFRLPQGVRDFLRAKAVAADRTASYILVEYLNRWIRYEEEEAKQPGRKK
jgi:predicted DNA-binding protein